MAKKTAPPQDGIEPPKHRARLDASSTYWGVEQVAALAPGDVEVPADCDLKPGHYRWNKDALPQPAFEPLPKYARRPAPEAPLMERALYDLMLSMQAAGHTLTPYCTEWMQWYATTLDARGANLKGGA